MQLDALGVTVDGPHGTLLRPTRLHAENLRPCVVAGPPGAGHTALALVLGGRLRPAAGQVLVDGAHDPQRLRETVALVDVPDVSEPDEVVKLSTVVGEELAMARRPASPHAVRSWLAHHDAEQWHGVRVEELPGGVRLHLLSELAALRPGIEGLVICCPDRYGTDADEALAVADRIARRDLLVVLQLMATTARILDHACVDLGNDEASDALTEDTEEIS